VRIAVLGNADAIHTRRWAGVLAARGHETRIFSLERFAAEVAHPAGEGAPITVVPGLPLPRALRYPLARGAFARALDDFAPDLVEAHFVPNYGFLGALVGRHPLSVQCWGSDLLVSATRSRLHAARARYALARADVVVADARVLGEAALAFGAAPERVLVVPWGADLARFPLAVPAARPHVVSVRQLEPLYDVATLVEALPAVQLAVPALSMTIAGDGPERETLVARVRALGLGDAVTFVGRVPHDRLAGLLGEGAAYVSTARSDSTSISLLEAMASGAVPVVTDIAGNREWIEDGAGGRLFPVGDTRALAHALVTTLCDGAFQRTARALNRARVEADGDWSRNVARVEARYESLVTREAARA
jgi:glycosyltransferase involved in cell wall biosynthesis